MDVWLELIIVVVVGVVSGMIGGFIGISMAAQSEIRRKIARAKVLKSNRAKRDDQIRS